MAGRGLAAPQGRRCCAGFCKYVHGWVLLGIEGGSISTLQPLCWVGIQQQGSASGLAGARAHCALPSARQGLGIALSGLCWGINQLQPLLNKQMQGSGSSHGFISCPGGSCCRGAGGLNGVLWAAWSGDALHSLVLVAQHLLCSGDCYIPAVSNLAATLLK